MNIKTLTVGDKSPCIAVKYRDDTNQVLYVRREDTVIIFKSSLPKVLANSKPSQIRQAILGNHACDKLDVSVKSMTVIKVDPRHLSVSIEVGDRMTSCELNSDFFIKWAFNAERPTAFGNKLASFINRIIEAPAC